VYGQCGLLTSAVSGGRGYGTVAFGELALHAERVGLVDVGLVGVGQEKFGQRNRVAQALDRRVQETRVPW
jgi:hypothetical protein